MNEYEIWVEGFSCTGQHQPASRITHRAIGNTFEDACLNYYYSQETGMGAYNARPLYNPQTNTIWGRKLFDNEADARASFG